MSCFRSGSAQRIGTAPLDINSVRGGGLASASCARWVEASCERHPCSSESRPALTLALQPVCLGVSTLQGYQGLFARRRLLAVSVVVARVILREGWGEAGGGGGVVIQLREDHHVPPTMQGCVCRCNLQLPSERK